MLSAMSGESVPLATAGSATTGAGGPGAGMGVTTSGKSGVTTESAELAEMSGLGSEGNSRPPPAAPSPPPPSPALWSSPPLPLRVSTGKTPFDTPTPGDLTGEARLGKAIIGEPVSPVAAGDLTGDGRLGNSIAPGCPPGRPGDVSDGRIGNWTAAAPIPLADNAPPEPPGLSDGKVTVDEALLVALDGGVRAANSGNEMVDEADDDGSVSDRWEPSSWARVTSTVSGRPGAAAFGNAVWAPNTLGALNGSGGDAAWARPDTAATGVVSTTSGFALAAPPTSSKKASMSATAPAADGSTGGGVGGCGVLPRGTERVPSGCTSPVEGLRSERLRSSSFFGVLVVAADDDPDE